jgi:hypothetical protein
MWWPGWLRFKQGLPSTPISSHVSFHPLNTNRLFLEEGKQIVDKHMEVFSAVNPQGKQQRSGLDLLIDVFAPQSDKDKVESSEDCLSGWEKSDRSLGLLVGV